MSGATSRRGSTEDMQLMPGGPAAHREEKKCPDDSLSIAGTQPEWNQLVAQEAWLWGQLHGVEEQSLECPKHSCESRQWPVHTVRAGTFSSTSGNDENH